MASWVEFLGTLQHLSGVSVEMAKLITQGIERYRKQGGLVIIYNNTETAVTLASWSKMLFPDKRFARM